VRIEYFFPLTEAEAEGEQGQGGAGAWPPDAMTPPQDYLNKFINSKSFFRQSSSIGKYHVFLFSHHLINQENKLIKEKTSW
jgi:hypothetical protein